MSLFITSLHILTAAAVLMLLLAGFKKVCGYIFLSSLAAVCSVGLVAAANVLCLKTLPPDLRAPWHIPFGEFYLGMDFLSAFFLLLFFILALAAGIYGHGYLRDCAGKRNVAAHYSFYHLLVISIMLILVAKNAVLFLIAWELMTVASYFLVTFYDEKESVRRAGYVYLIATHTGTFCLLIMFLLMGSQTGSMNFDQMMTAQFPSTISAALFVLAVMGFGVKAGFIPLHVWLPHAHPAAPSHISALLSGVVIKIGIYGLMRIISIVKDFPAWCGVSLLVIGAVSGVCGVLYALGQHEIKKLLAYHSIENMGIITLGLGMGLMGQSFHQESVAFIGYAGALLHVFNHAMFKGLLFLCAGTVIRATDTGEIDHMGGLLKRLPWTGHLFLIGSLSICGFPFFNGFISEWLVYQALLGCVFHFDIYGVVFSCLGGASLALIGGLAALCFAKAFGTIFLGRNRSMEQHDDQESSATASRLSRAAEIPWQNHTISFPIRQESGFMSRGPMVGLAAICIWEGLFPGRMVAFSLQAAQSVTGMVMPLLAKGIFNPLSAAIFVLLIGVIIYVVLSVLRNFLLRGRPLRQTETWGCGYAQTSPRMQYTASSFAEPMLRICRTLLVFKVQTVKLKKYFPAGTQLNSSVLDASEYLFIRPMLSWIKTFSGKFNWIQSGHTQRYLLYIFFFLLILLAWKLR
jgi:hydrogenase-4 component B